MTTIRVRIAVAVAANGTWSASGDSRWSDSEATCCSLDSLDIDDARITFIEADVPLPEEPGTIRGIVT